jgi:hypothetical protein
MADENNLRGPATKYDTLVGGTRLPITKTLQESDLLQRFFQSFAPGAEPFAAKPYEAPKPPGEGAFYFAAGRENLHDDPLAPREPDALDRALARYTLPPATLGEPDYVLDRKATPLPQPSFWEGVKQGLATETLPGMFFSHQALKNQIMALPGELQPVPGYDFRQDDRIQKAGLGAELWSFRDSASPNETLFRIWQHEARRKDAALTERMVGMSGIGVFLGAMADPLMTLPIVGNSAAVTKGVWGTMWRGARAASINSAYMLAGEHAKSELDDSYRMGGILDALEIPAALGFAAGIISGRTARHPETFNPRRGPKPGEPGGGHPEGGPSYDPVYAEQVRRTAFEDMLSKGLLRNADGTRPTIDDLMGKFDGFGPTDGALFSYRGKSVSLDELDPLKAAARETPEKILKDAPPHPSEEESVMPRNLSSASATLATSYLDKLLNAESLKETGLGVEHLPLNPALRLLQSTSLEARRLVTALADLGGMKQKKNIGPFAEPTSVPVEAETARLWKTKAITAMNEMQAAWLEARGDAVPAGQRASKTAFQVVRKQAADWINREAGLTWAAFDERVGKAMRRGDKDSVRDGHSASVEKAAAAARRYLDELKDAAEDPNVDLFGKANQRTIEKMQKEIAALKAKGLDASQPEARLKRAVEQLGKSGTQSTALSYFTRYWNVEQVTRRKDVFLQRIEGYFVSRGVPADQARTSAQDVFATITGSQMKTISEEAEDIFRKSGDPMSAKTRMLEIPDLLVEDFLESSASLAIRHQMATFAPAIEMTRRFGDATLENVVERVKEDYRKAYDAAKVLSDAPLMQKLDAGLKQDIEDIQTLRDRMMNTAGASKDPHSWDQRTIRMLKHYMTWTSMGLSSFSQLGDLARPALTEGLDAMHRYGFATLMSGSRRTIMEMAERERLLAGDSLEMVTGAMGLSMSDIGDVFSSRSNLERTASRATNAYYMLNGMNWTVDLTKNWASVIVQSNINDAIYQWGMHILDNKNAAPSAKMMERLRSLSIDGNDALRIAKELAGKGIQFKSVHMANTEAWADTGARDLYRQAFQRALQRTVVTPGIADKPTWMSTPIGSLIGQFKSFGMSSTIRTLYAGLQDRDRNFWQGAAVMVGAGVVLNEIRSQLFYGRSGFDQPFLGALMDGADRSGVLGSVTDINSVLEAASNNRLGMRPLMGAAKTMPVTPDRLAGTFLGPAAGKGILAADTLGRLLEGDATLRTTKQMRQFVPGHNLPYADPFADAIFGSGRSQSELAPPANKPSLK